MLHGYGPAKRVFTKRAKNVLRKIEILENLGSCIEIDKSEIMQKQQVTFFGES